MPGFLPVHLLLAAFGGWVNRHQADAIAYLIEENRVLKEQQGGRRLQLSDDQRRRLAAKGQRLGRPLLSRVATIVTPDTILRWHRRLIALKHTYPSRRVGRPGLIKEIRALIVRMAEDNPPWGYCRIQGELKKVGHRVARSTIAKTLKDHGVPPTSERATSWRGFLRTHADAIAATDFLTAEVWTKRGLVTHYILFVIDHATRAVEIVGCTTRFDRGFMAQIARNRTDPEDGALRRKKFLALDRDTKFTDQFHRFLGDAGVTTVRTAFQAPNMNAIAERFIGSLKRECLEQLILFGEAHLQRALREYVAHYNTNRSHQGIGNELIAAPVTTDSGNSGPIVEHERLGGLLRSYSRAA